MSLPKELSGVAKVTMALDAEECYTPKNIMITGGAGFIGSHVVTRLVAKYPQYKVCLRRLLVPCDQVEYLPGRDHLFCIIASGVTNSGVRNSILPKEGNS
jgi:hypothetical protein